MKLSISEKWMPVEDRIEDPEKTNLKMFIGLAIFVGILIALFILMWQEALLIDSSGETVEYFTLDLLWTLVIGISVCVGVPLILYIAFKDCHNVMAIVDVSIVLSIGGLLAAHLIIEAIWFMILITGATGDLHTIYAMEIAIQSLMAITALIITAWGARLIYYRKKQCDVVIKGRTMPIAYASGQGISARIQCKELDGKMMCKIPRIDSIE